MQLPVEKLHPFEGHPFKVKDDAEMEQLILSIRTQGLLTPIAVHPIENNEYEVVSGHRRLHACKKAGIETVPGKTYDLQNDSDEQFTDMKFMFSRYELKTINKRLVRGRNQSASEGKFMGSMAPYGYRAYLEKGIYTTEMFTKRNLALENEIKQLRKSEEDLLKQKSEGKQKEVAHTQIIPAAQHILESYPILTLEEKNRLWKLVLKKVTIYRSPDDEITIQIHPNLPK